MNLICMQICSQLTENKCKDLIHFPDFPNKWTKRYLTKNKAFKMYYCCGGREREQRDKEVFNVTSHKTIHTDPRGLELKRTTESLGKAC